jgi:hypothetical protein
VLYESLEYIYPVAKLAAGGSYGNPDCFARTDARSNLDGFWLAGTNQWVCGTATCTLRGPDGTPLLPDETYFRPGHQTTTYRGAGVRARLTTFVPYGLPVGHGGHCYLVVELEAEAASIVELTWDIRWPPFNSPVHTKQPERDQWQKRMRQWQEGARFIAATVPTHYTRYNSTTGDPNEVRVFGGPQVPAAWETSEPARLRATYRVELAAGEPWQGGWLLSAGTAGVDSVRAAHEAAAPWSQALAGTIAALEEVLCTSHLYTPDPVINRGLQWAKANTIRVQHQFRKGVGFTNDPPQDIVVVRDCAWYGLGADWLTPGFVRAMNDLLLTYGIHPGGKLTEYIHADTGAQEDYALNVNDDTPLFVVAAHHHYAATGDGEYLGLVYPAVRGACDWLLSQRRDGLVWCDVEGTDVWGNATWRNIIPGYHLAGAVTEINSLAVWALACAAGLAEAAGAPEDAARWRQARADLLAAMRKQLFAPETGTYLLNRDETGRHLTLTADLVFPVLGGVAEGEQARGILDRLYSPQFYTPFGIHTVGQGEAEYHPSYGYGLMGGLWPNLTAWVAYAGRRQYPARLAEMMDHLYALCEVPEPRAGGHMAPGEFPEWFHGETYESLGMAMSPWMPPTYLWLGIEGLAGIEAQPSSLRVAPNLPPDWTWFGLRNLPYRGGQVSLFAHDGRLYSTLAVDTEWPLEQFERDATDEIGVVGPLYALALAGAQTGVVLVGTVADVHGAIRWGSAVQPVDLRAGQAVVLRFDL